MIGTTIAHYEITSKLGQGGMGEVFQARDTKLDREVALKFLPLPLQQDEGARIRFIREAKAAAAIDHPFICSIYEVGETEDGHSFIAMEYVAGQTLQEKLEDGPIPLDEALPILIEAAEAIEKAHSAGFVHRDLKPANLMLTPEGHVKVMDFGLAKRILSQGATEQEITAGLTREGSTLGTLSYMSPEQIRGEELDARSDIFSFGVILFETLTGQHPFRRKQPMETASAIMNEPAPPLGCLMAEVPYLLERIVGKLLSKEPDRRYQLIHDVKTDLEDLRREFDSGSERALRPRSSQAQRGSSRRLVFTLGFSAAALVLAVIVLSVLYFTETPTEQHPVRFSVSLPEKMEVRAAPAISPDGRQIAVVMRRDDARSSLWIRSLDKLTEIELAGTEGASYPFWSPDSRLLGFFADEKLKRVPPNGGMVQTLCDAPDARGGSWSPNGLIVFGTRRDGLYQVPENGGSVVPVTTLDPSRGELSHRFPHFLPDGRHYLFVAEVAPAERGEVYLGDLESDSRSQLSGDYSKTIYVDPGHLLFVREDTLMAQAFDADALELVGEPYRVMEGVSYRAGVGQGHFSISKRGDLVFIPGSAVSVSLQPRRLVWVDRQGQEEILTPEPKPYFAPQLSPDGTRVVLEVIQGVTKDLWIYDLTRQVLTRLTSDGAAAPLWSPDGRRVLFSNRGGVFWKAADGTGAVERLTTEPTEPRSFSPDGSLLVLGPNSESPSYASSLKVLKLGEESSSEPLFQGSQAVLSPDGRWIAYASRQSGKAEIYVRPFPNVTEGQWQVSRDGGYQPVWKPDGRELFYYASGEVFAVPISTEPTFTPGTPEVLFQFRGLPLLRFDISPDGERFLMLKVAEREPLSNQLIVILNWIHDLEKQTGTK